MDTRFFYDRNQNKIRMFMQMGRKSETIHKFILDYLHKKDITDSDENYIYEKEKGKIIFPETNDLAMEINKTNYFVATPQYKENQKKNGKDI